MEERLDKKFEKRLKEVKKSLEQRIEETLMGVH